MDPEAVDVEAAQERRKRQSRLRKDQRSHPWALSSKT
jgi:hypothetical protein